MIEPSASWSTPSASVADALLSCDVPAFNADAPELSVSLFDLRVERPSPNCLVPPVAGCRLPEAYKVLNTLFQPQD